MIAVDPIARLFFPRPPEGEENKKSFTDQKNARGKKTKTKINCSSMSFVPLWITINTNFSKRKMKLKLIYFQKIF